MAAIVLDLALSEVAHLEARRIDHRAELMDPDASSPEAAFIGDTWRYMMRRPVVDLRELLRQPGVVVAIATPRGEPDVFLGWIAAIPGRNAIVAIYVKALFRAKPGEESEFRVGSSLALLAGISFDRPVECLTWNRTASKVQALPGNPYRLVGPR